MKVEAFLKGMQGALLFLVSIGMILVLPMNTSAEEIDPRSLESRSHLLGDLGGLRSTMESRGIVPEVHYFSTAMGALGGGVDQGGAYKGNFKVGLDANLETLFGLPGARVFLSAFTHHGQSLSRRSLGDSLGNRKDDVANSTHLFEFGYEQHLFQDHLSIKIGQIAVSSDFFGSVSGFFLHDSFNWQPNGQSGAPSGPDSALGARIRADLTPEVYLQAAVYDNATSGGFGTDLDDKQGTKWAIPSGDRSVWLFEGGLTPDAENHENWPTLKMGGWINAAQTPDLLTGMIHDSNWGIYFIGEQTLWSEDQASNQGLRIFTRFNRSASDRNQFDWELNAGLLYTGLIPNRDEDVVGIGYTHAEVSGDWKSSMGTGSSEEAFEFKYAARITPWWSLEPFAQLIVNPGRPNGRDLNNVLVLGMISSISF